ncbi:hypothetical protein F1B92_04245 [Campylobacter sp. FMV-PI01]|uniref:Uncharacterized protein n=1 Tax=Campylobacter portucalensis TaxID=2608384 RepID=A0A6L5WJG8_9BACT|nr:hypothetical protein [Campylobacter portucalensis]MSN96397.1 hypothetical protein [Campylobacter portucalensis]
MVNYYMIFLAIKDIVFSIFTIFLYVTVLLFVYYSFVIKDISTFKFSIQVFVFFNIFFLLPILNYDIMQRLNFGNINYPYIILDKNAKLPNEIYIDDGNLTDKSESNKTIPTYFIKKDDRIELYNIKVLSTLGDSWYIETQNGFRFKLDKNLIETEILKE